MEQLLVLGALNSERQLTTLGKQMALFPLEPRYAKVLIKSRELNCANEVIIIVAMLSSENIFFTPGRVANQHGDDDFNPVKELDAAKKTFTSSYGDHMLLYNVYNAYRQSGEDKQWCIDNLINWRSMKRVEEVRLQLIEYWNSLNWPLKQFYDADEQGL